MKIDMSSHFYSPLSFETKTKTSRVDSSHCNSIEGRRNLSINAVELKKERSKDSEICSPFFEIHRMAPQTANYKSDKFVLDQDEKGTRPPKNVHTTEASELPISFTVKIGFEILDYDTSPSVRAINRSAKFCLKVKRNSIPEAKVVAGIRAKVGGSAGQPMRKVIVLKGISCFQMQLHNFQLFALQGKNEDSKTERPRVIETNNQDKSQAVHKTTSLPITQLTSYSRVANRYKKGTSQSTERTLIPQERII